MQQRQLDHMTRELQLTPDQVGQIRAIQLDGLQKMQTLRNDTTSSGQDRRARMMSLRDDENGKIRAVLTEDQKVKYSAMRAHMEERRHEGGRDGSGPPPPPPPSN